MASESGLNVLKPHAIYRPKITIRCPPLRTTQQQILFKRWKNTKDSTEEEMRRKFYKTDGTTPKMEAKKNKFPDNLCRQLRFCGRTPFPIIPSHEICHKCKRRKNICNQKGLCIFTLKTKTKTDKNNLCLKRMYYYQTSMFSLRATRSSYPRLY